MERKGKIEIPSSRPEGMPSAVVRIRDSGSNKLVGNYHIIIYNSGEQLI